MKSRSKAPNVPSGVTFRPVMRVLIADDDPIIRLDLKEMLENLGYNVVAEAGDGQQAVDLARTSDPDVCILDVKMPNKDGIEAVNEIYGEAIAPCILLTAYSDKELIERAMEAGVFAYLVKPFKPSDLPPAIEVARSRFDHHQRLEKEVTSLNDRIEARKIIEKAKGKLIEEQRLSEIEAYRHIQVESMNRRMTMKEIAEEILNG
ncbi:MAG: response regulator [Armatimonadetes bacterium]|nr:response regulator [Armatimonadota bacterium]